MKFAESLTAVVATATVSSAFSPKKMQEIRNRAAATNNQTGPQLLGDLATLSAESLTPTGKAIRGILLKQDAGHDIGGQTAATSNGSSKDVCGIWKPIADDMAQAMAGPDRQCNDVARAAIRLGFHDAGAWSMGTASTGGGADGSIVLARECETREENNGLQDICSRMRAWFDKYKQHDISMADLIQMGANVGTVVCPLGPRVRSFVGRKDNNQPGPENLLPGPDQSAEQLITMFADKTISPQGLVALVGSHSAARQRFVERNRTGDTLDSTPGIWDTRFYDEVVDSKTAARVFKLQSDVSLSQDPRTKDVWSSYVGAQAQESFIKDYASEYVRLSLLGVNNINDLTECTQVLPPFIASLNSVPSAAFQGNQTSRRVEPVPGGGALRNNSCDGL
ncbi:hypothetical protein L249_0725 [Ophiocordyceps polyrhachis-furcata BCC 54312]|uniref:Peroxidase n=1 Tax=Ophiocordyceps polyrhachis-furcata BCC 54312 TaxID=1330021 RepID=A0A367LEE7_9HYPO|nr:hypothetical protein L249_0725 [Ophiocordyceps polyrhachis-furcata BCC 54312]